jgi:hypothetical protein
MDISNFTRKLAGWFRQPSFEPDPVIDSCIRDALLEEVDVPIPEGTWERLRRAVIEHQSSVSRGMWILNEPFRDPPESSPSLLTQQQFEYARRIYHGSQYGRSSRLAWESFRISFSIVVSL